MPDDLGPTTPLRRARWLLGNATAGMHGGTDDATVFNWIYEAYTLLSEAIDGEHSDGSSCAPTDGIDK